VIEPLQCLRVLPVELKPRVRIRWLPWLTSEGPQPFMWELRAPQWNTLQGIDDTFINATLERALVAWAADVQRTHKTRFETLVYRSRREYYEMRAMLLHAGKP
jgi:hypothetical protein